MDLEGFSLDEDEYRDDTISYTSNDTEDDFIEIIETKDPISSGEMVVVIYYKTCSRAKIEVFGAHCDYTEYVKKSVKEIYEK